MIYLYPSLIINKKLLSKNTYKIDRWCFREISNQSSTRNNFWYCFTIGMSWFFSRGWNIYQSRNAEHRHAVPIFTTYVGIDLLMIFTHPFHTLYFDDWLIFDQLLLSTFMFPGEQKSIAIWKNSRSYCLLIKSK